jgi:hypothetical protein
MRNAEIDNPRPVIREQDIGWFEVPVHHPYSVNYFQSLGQPGR